jgi:hypothetical protein
MEVTHVTSSVTVLHAATFCTYTIEIFHRGPCISLNVSTQVCRAKDYTCNFKNLHISSLCSFDSGRSLFGVM